jgi:ribonuclease HI
MELQAVIEALGFLDDNDECLIYSDSQLVINCAVGKWKRNANKDLWEIYDKNIKNKKVKYEWIKGHNGNEYNELVDKVAKDEARLCI